MCVPWLPLQIWPPVDKYSICCNLALTDKYWSVDIFELGHELYGCNLYYSSQRNVIEICDNVSFGMYESAVISNSVFATILKKKATEEFAC